MLILNKNNCIMIDVVKPVVRLYLTLTKVSTEKVSILTGNIRSDV